MATEMELMMDFSEECLRLYYLIERDSHIDSIRAWMITKEHHPNPDMKDINAYLSWRHPLSFLTPFSLVVTKNRMDVLRLLNQMGLDLDNKHLVGRFVGSSTILAASSYKPDILEYLLVDCCLGCRELPEVTSLFSLTPCHPPTTQHFIRTCRVILNQPLGRLFGRSLYVNWHWLVIQEQTTVQELEFFLVAFGHGPYPGCTLPTLFCSACSVKNLPIARFLLEYCDGVLLNECIQDATAAGSSSRCDQLHHLLLYAVIEDFLPATKYLLGLEPALASMVFGQWGTTPLMLACYCKAETTVVYLSTVTDVNVADSTGYTALHYAMAGRSLRTVQYLIEGAGLVLQDTLDELRARDAELTTRPPVTCVQYSLSHMMVTVAELQDVKAAIMGYLAKVVGQ